MKTIEAWLGIHITLSDILENIPWGLICCFVLLGILFWILQSAYSLLRLYAFRHHYPKKWILNAYYCRKDKPANSESMNLLYRKLYRAGFHGMPLIERDLLMLVNYVEPKQAIVFATSGAYLGVKYVTDRGVKTTKITPYPAVFVMTKDKIIILSHGLASDNQTEVININSLAGIYYSDHKTFIITKNHGDVFGFSNAPASDMARLVNIVQNVLNEQNPYNISAKYSQEASAQVQQLITWTKGKPIYDTLKHVAFVKRVVQRSLT